VSEEGDSIRIEELELSVRIGVPDEERAKPQRLTISISMWPEGGIHDLDDELDRTINYAAVCQEVKACAFGRADRLIETMAEAIASHLLATFPLVRVHVEVRKFILSEVKHVAVLITRERQASASV